MRFLFVGLLHFLFIAYCNAGGNFRIPLSVLERPTNASIGPGDSYGVKLSNFGDIEYYGRFFELK